MYPEERRQQILQLVRTNTRVGVTSLAAGLQVAVETIRRDLDALERTGVLRRVHGGAIAAERASFQPLRARDTRLTVEQERIVEAALAELPEEGAIFLDTGTTTAGLARALPPDRELTVVVSSPDLALTLSTRPELTVLILGGRVRGKAVATVDHWTLRPLTELCIDVAFLGTNGCSARRGLTAADHAHAAIKRAMIAVARRAVVLADHKTIGKDCLARFASLADLDLLITGSGLDDNLADEVAAAGVRVVRV